MILRPFLDDRRSFVGRTIIDHDEFIRLERLRKYARNGLLDPLRPVVERNDRNDRKIGIPVRHGGPLPKSGQIKVDFRSQIKLTVMYAEASADGRSHSDARSAHVTDIKAC